MCSSGRLVDSGYSIPLLALRGGWVFGAAKHCGQNELLNEGAGLYLAPESRHDTRAGQADDQTWANVTETKRFRPQKKQNDAADPRPFAPRNRRSGAGPTETRQNRGFLWAGGLNSSKIALSRDVTISPARPCHRSQGPMPTNGWMTRIQRLNCQAEQTRKPRRLW